MSREDSPPREASSKMYVPKIKPIHFGKKKIKSRDPRFLETCSTPVNLDTYSFVYDLKKTELKNKKIKDPKMISQVANQINKYEQIKQLQKIKRDFKQEQKEKIEQGKNPFFINSKIIKEKITKEKTEKLKKEGKLEEYERRKNLKKSKTDFQPPKRKEH